MSRRLKTADHTPFISGANYTMTDTLIKGWVPYRLDFNKHQLICHWLDTGRTRFTAPFFDHTISRIRTTDRNLMTFSPVSDIAALPEWANGLDAVEPAAIIFHVSRCGSTLVSQLLATSAENIVLSEVPFLDALLRLPLTDERFDRTAINELYTAALNFYGHDKTGLERRVFIKADSWHLFFYEQLRSLFPSVPFIILYRSPDEIFQSHKKIAGIQTVPGLIEPQLLGLDPDLIYAMSRDEYIAAVLETFFTKILEIAVEDDNMILINYNDGPMAMVKQVAAFANIALDENDLEKMETRSHYHSKRPETLFTEEPAQAVPACLDNAITLYRAVEVKRIAILA